MSTSSSAEQLRLPGLFAGRRILVVGGTSGIGEGIATAFAALGGERRWSRRHGGGSTGARGAPRAVALDVRDEAAVDGR